MNIPNFVHNNIVDSNLIMDPSWLLWFSQLIQEMQKALGSAGFYPTPLTTAQIADLNPAACIGCLIFNKTTGQYIINKTGSFSVLA